MEWRRLLLTSLLSGAVLFMVGVAFHVLIPVVAPHVQAEYDDEVQFRPGEGWTRTYMVIHPWVVGALFAGGFLGARTIVGRDRLGGARDGTLYGLALFAVGALPVFALEFASFQVPTDIVLAWAIQCLAQYSLAGLALGGFVRRAGR